MKVDPMLIIDVSRTEELKQAILVTIAKGNPIIPHPSQEEMSKPVTIHKKLGFKTYKAFNHEAKTWGIVLKDGIYGIDFYKISDDGRGFNSIPSQKVTFPTGNSVETVVDRLIAIIQETHRQQFTSKKNRES
jgi:hypothetical protein